MVNPFLWDQLMSFLVNKTNKDIMHHLFNCCFYLTLCHLNFLRCFTFPKPSAIIEIKSCFLLSLLFYVWECVYVLKVTCFTLCIEWLDSYENYNFRVLFLSYRKFRLLGQRVKQSAHFLEVEVQCFHHSHLVFMSINIEAFSFAFLSLL